MTFSNARSEEKFREWMMMKWMVMQPPALIAQAQTTKRALKIKNELKCDSLTATILSVAPHLQKGSEAMKSLICDHCGKPQNLPDGQVRPFIGIQPWEGHPKPKRHYCSAECAREDIYKVALSYFERKEAREKRIT